MPTILITNDDGCEAPGIVALHQAMNRLGRVIRVAPDRDRSGAGHALTLNHPLRIKTLGDGIHAVDGTPTDCVNLGLFNLLNKPPDLVVSGINETPNLGDDITYSGTVSAAMEGRLLGVPSFAISQDQNGAEHPFKQAVDIATRVARRILRGGLPPDTLLNVNVPGQLARGVRWTRQGKRVYSEGVVERVDPLGRQYFWIGGVAPSWEEDPRSDHAALLAGYVSITPLRLDLTHDDVLASLRTNWRI